MFFLSKRPKIGQNFYFAFFLICNLTSQRYAEGKDDAGTKRDYSLKPLVFNQYLRDLTSAIRYVCIQLTVCWK